MTAYVKPIVNTMPFMTAYVAPIVKTAVTMTDSRFDSTALPLLACSRSAHERSVRRGAMIEDGDSKEEETEMVSSSFATFLCERFFLPEERNAKKCYLKH